MNGIEGSCRGVLNRVRARRRGAGGVPEQAPEKASLAELQGPQALTAGRTTIRQIARRRMFSKWAIARCMIHSMAFLSEGSMVQVASFRILKKTLMKGDRGK